VTATTLRQAFTALAAVALVAAFGFAGAIVVLASSGFVLHEVAGAVLLVLLAGAIVVAARSRSEDPRPLSRSLVGLVLLLAMGASGAALGLNVAPSWLDALPMVLLAGLIVALAEMVRVGRAEPPAPPGPFRPDGAG